SFISPHVGCTHDVQFETFMKENFDTTSNRTGGTMEHVTGKPAQYTTLFEEEEVDVATAPEPWASVLEEEQDANVVIDTPEVSLISTHVGCTHDVQFETFMKENFDTTSNRTGGTMEHVTGKPAQYTTLFEEEEVDVATAPEPWASVLEEEQDANVVIDTPEVS